MPSIKQRKRKVLALSQPRLPNATKPVVGANYGVPKHAYDLQPRGLRVDIDPPPFGMIVKGDRVHLVVNDKWAEGSKVITEEEENQVITLYLPKGLLLPERVNDFYYYVERASGNHSQSEPPQKLLYNAIRPGKEDTTPGDGAHSRLKITLPNDVIENGIDAERAKEGVLVSFSYPYCRAHDAIWLNCNGVDVLRVVTETEAPAIPSDTPTTITVLVEEAIFLRAGDSPRFVFSYTVIDQLGNGPDTDSPYSGQELVDVHLGEKRFAKPILREELDDPDDKPDIELGKLKDEPLKIVIVPTDDRFVAGYKVTTFYTASHPDHPTVSDQQTEIVEVDQYGQKKLIVIEVPNLKVNTAGSTVRVFYEVRKPGIDEDTPGYLVGRSNTTIAQVVGVHLELKPPSVLQASGATLDPMAGLTRLTVVVPQGNTLPTDLLSICWTAKPGTHVEGSIITEPKPISEIGLNIDIPPGLMAFCLGDSVTVSYIIARDGEELASETLTLTVQDLPQSALTAPRLKEADADGEGPELNLAKLTPKGKMWCPAFALIAEGQFVWLLFEGTNADGSRYEKYIWAAPYAFVNAQWIKDGFFEAVAPYEDLKGLLDGSSLTIEMFIAFGKREDLALAKRFMVRTYTVSAVEDVAPTITLVEGSPSEKEIPHGGFTVETAATVSGKAAEEQNVEVFVNEVSKGRPLTDANGGWSLLLSALGLGLNTLVATARYGSEQSSDERTLSVTALLKPTLTNVQDETGEEVPDNGFTVSKTLTLSGQASAFQEVEIFDGVGSAAVSRGKAIADATTNWQKTIAVDLGERVFFARSLYHSSDTDSEIRKLAVTEDITPILSSVKDSLREVTDGKTTADDILTISGIASAGQSLQLYDEDLPIGSTIQVENDGSWNHRLIDLKFKKYTLTAKARYGANRPSAPARTFTIVNYIEEDFDDVLAQTISYRGQKIETPVMTIEQLVDTYLHYEASTSIRLVSSPVTDQIDGHCLYNHNYRSYKERLTKCKFKNQYKKISFWFNCRTNTTEDNWGMLLLNGETVVKDVVLAAPDNATLFHTQETPVTFDTLIIYNHSGSGHNLFLDHIRLYR